MYFTLIPLPLMQDVQRGPPHQVRILQELRAKLLLTLPILVVTQWVQRTSSATTLAGRLRGRMRLSCTNNNNRSSVRPLSPGFRQTHQ